MSHLTYASAALSHLKKSNYNRLNRLIRRCHKIVCFPACKCDKFVNVEKLIDTRNHKLFIKVLNNSKHPLADYLPHVLPSGRLNQIVFKSTKRGNSFMPKYTSMHNSYFKRV